ncbi:MAG: D-glycero-alpha-D-manno-heptose-1,7-bisphosphate 7-phosphatase [Gemmatimonadaceae bacterium]
MSAAGDGASPPRPAVFLDRDGTLIDDVHYISRAEDVRLLPGAAAAVRRLNEAGVPVIVITNQSGIARGIVTPAAYEAVHARLAELLAAEGARLDATYFCPHGPDDGCRCRKPGIELYERAIAEHRLDGARAFFVGDRLRDLQPARAFGGGGVLVPSADTPTSDVVIAQSEYALSTSLAAAVDRILSSERLRGAVRPT